MFSRSPKLAYFVKAPDGSVNFGEITEGIGKKIKRQAAPIRLPRGVQNPDGTGYGLAHIEANHGEHIRKAGFESVESFVAHVAKDFSQIWQVSGRQLLIAVRSARQDMMYVQLEPTEDGDYYRVNSAFPVRQKTIRKDMGLRCFGRGANPPLLPPGNNPHSLPTLNQKPVRETPTLAAKVMQT